MPAHHALRHRCGSPSLRNEHFCYYHHTTRPKKSSTAIKLGAPRKHTAFDLPRPEDRISVQHSIGEVIRLLAADEIDPRRAGLLLYGLQIASHNLPKSAPTTQPIEDLTPALPQQVEQDQLDEPDGQAQEYLAPEAEFQVGPHEKTLEEILNEQWEQYKPLVDSSEEAILPPGAIPLRRRQVHPQP